MSKFEIVMPKMGESIIEATITRWLKKVGETIAEDEPLAEIATDKVDSEIPSPVEGKLVKLLYNEGDMVAVGTIIAIIAMDGEEVEADDPVPAGKPTEIIVTPAMTPVEEEMNPQADDRFYSPLVRSIAKEENISMAELAAIPGSGKDNRLNKQDMLNYLELKKSGKVSATTASEPSSVAITVPVPSTHATPKPAPVERPKVISNAGDEIIEMDRMRRLIADHMVMSKQVSPHVTSFIDVDVTNIVNWRSRMKDEFLKRDQTKLTFTPIFIEAAAKALKDYPQVNASVDGYKMILRKNINIGMATALPSGNLIVPVIRNADQLNLIGMAKQVNDLANRARANKLDPDDIQGGTFTVTNFGSFNSLTGTPIINQPQVAILGLGAIRKQPVVLETDMGDVIAIRHIVILSLAYDHRIVDGALGGMYLKRMKEYLENFDTNRTA